MKYSWVPTDSNDKKQQHENQYLWLYWYELQLVTNKVDTKVSSIKLQDLTGQLDVLDACPLIDVFPCVWLWRPIFIYICHDLCSSRLRKLLQSHHLQTEGHSLDQDSLGYIAGIKWSNKETETSELWWRYNQPIHV